MKLPIESKFSTALRYVRKATGMTQEDFDEVSSRVYISALERGIKQPTLLKVDALADRLKVHPLTLLALSYSSKPSSEEIKGLCDQVLFEVENLSSQAAQKASQLG
jgi:transcriptional regulator with XRE-family HTH domain